VPYQNYLNLKDEELDKPVYRIMPVNRLLQCLEEKQLVLVPPSKWDDPFENWLLSSKVKFLSTGESGDMDGIRNKIYGQCWTQHRETDAMWRIYSSDTNGAKIKTTPRKLLEALKGGNTQSGDVSCFIGKVQYQTQTDLTSSLTSINVFDTNGSGIAESLLYKRREFSHEKEVRLIYTEGNGPVYPFNIDPSDMFDEIVFDPRVDKHLFSAYKAAVVAMGFLGKVTQSTLYRPPQGLLIKI
jgi:hypothetical protein